jgi:hypothetical protein
VADAIVSIAGQRGDRGIRINMEELAVGRHISGSIDQRLVDRQPV